jgi:hypothetical protein
VANAGTRPSVGRLPVDDSRSPSARGILPVQNRAPAPTQGYNGARRPVAGQGTIRSTFLRQGFRGRPPGHAGYAGGRAIVNFV